MEIDRLGLATLVVLAAVLGSVGTQQVLDQRYSSLQKKVNDLEAAQSRKGVNLSRDQALTRLFHETDQSVVSIQSFGKQNAQGSGFVYTDQGHIITNEHVISGADRIEVTFTDGRTMNAELVGKDPYSDLAVLNVDRQDLEPLELGNSSQVEVGQTAIAFGNPFGLRGSMTSGIVSQKGRRIQGEGGFSIPNVIQTDAAINPGNSGGPLMNIDGKVIGVNTAIQTSTGTFSGIGFAIPSNTVRSVADRIIDNGEVEHPWIGVEGVNMNDQIAQAMGVNVSSGFLVVGVVNDSPAEKAGLKGGNVEKVVDGQKITVGGDIIVGLDGRKMRDLTDVYNFLFHQAYVGEKVNVTVVRNGSRKTFSLTLGSRKNR